MPEPTKSGTLMIESKVCDGCNLEQPLYFEVSGANDFCFCPQCLFNGQAKQKASDYFNDSDYILEGDKKVSKPRYLEEFQYHTPQFFSWQDNIWLTHCDDFCSYLGIVYWSDIQKLGKEVEAQIIADFKQSKQDFSIASIKKNLQEDSEMVGHLFQCCHCKKFRLYIELS